MWPVSWKIASEQTWLRLSVTKESQKTVALAFLLLGYLRFGNISLVRMVKACFPFFKAMI